MGLAKAVLMVQHHCRAGALLPSWYPLGAWSWCPFPVVLGETLLAGSAPSAVFKASCAGHADVGQLILQAGSGGVLLLLAEGEEQALCISWAGSRNISKCDMELPSMGMEHPSLLSCQEPLSLHGMGQDSWGWVKDAAP